MKRYGMVLGLQPGKIEEYKKLHAAVWPDVLKMIKQCHIQNYSIYLHQLDDGQHCLFSYFEYTGADFAADMAKMAADSDDTTLVVTLQAVPEAPRAPRPRGMVGEHGRGLPLRLTTTTS